MSRAAPTEIQRPLRELLELDASLSSTDAKVLEHLLLDPRPTVAREISRATRTNLQGLYGSLDRLVARGLVARAEGPSSMTFRVANPRVVLHELLAPYSRARELADELEGPLRTLYEARPGTRPNSTGDSLTTSSTATASSWLLDRLSSGAKEVWIVGLETPWFGRSPALESELAARSNPESGGGVRLLVPPPDGDDPRAARHARLIRSGMEVRYSPRFSSPAVIIDRQWMLVRSRAASTRGGTDAAFLRLETPELCADIATAAEEEWARTSGSTGSRGTESGRVPGVGPGPRRRP